MWSTLPEVGQITLLNSGCGRTLSGNIEAQQKAVQTERLAAIGQMMTGLAHESGNALARSQACLEMLALEVADRPEACELINRIQKAQDHLQQLYEEVRSYAAPFKLEREVWDVALTWRQAWENLAVRRQGRDAQIQEECDRVNRQCAIDPFRLEQVFRNILDNSLAAAATRCASRFAALPQNWLGVLPFGSWPATTALA